MKSILKILFYHLGLCFLVALFHFFGNLALPSLFYLNGEYSLIRFSLITIDLLYVIPLSAMYFSVGNILSRLSKRKLLHSFFFALAISGCYKILIFIDNAFAISMLFDHYYPPISDFSDISLNFILLFAFVVPILDILFITLCVYAGSRAASFFDNSRVNRIMSIIGCIMCIALFISVLVCWTIYYIYRRIVPWNQVLIFLPVLIYAVVRLTMLIRYTQRWKA